MKTKKMLHPFEEQTSQGFPENGVLALCIGERFLQLFFLPLMLQCLFSCQSQEKIQPEKRSSQTPSVSIEAGKGDYVVTQGDLEIYSDSLYTNKTAQLRSHDLNKDKSDITLTFKYLGPHKEQKLLKSGLEREQIGLKLKAQDTCNVIYVMWRNHPRPSVVVSKKYNPGKTKHKECGNEGYKNLQTLILDQPLKVNEEHTLVVHQTSTFATITIDNKKTMTIPYDSEMQSLRGPFGIRVDNGAFAFNMK